MQAAGGDQPAEGGHRAAEEAAHQEEASQPGVSVPVGGFRLGAQAAQDQGGQRQRLGPLPQALPAPAVSQAPRVHPVTAKQDAALFCGFHALMFVSQTDAGRVPRAGGNLQASPRPSEEGLYR